MSTCVVFFVFWKFEFDDVMAATYGSELNSRATAF